MSDVAAVKMARWRQVGGELEARLGKPRPLQPQTPTERQRDFLACDAFECLYGGAAGGGKSSALLLSALQYVHVPHYAALILRRTFTDLNLPGAILDRAKSWLLRRGVAWNQQLARFTFTSGATLTFGYLETSADRFRYQGSEVQFLGVDELTQFREGDYRYMLSRLRRTKDIDVPLRARAASNPGGVGHDWVYRRFVDPKSREGRAFVPALWTDNPHLGEDYKRSLDQLSTVERAQLLEGQWVRDGAGLVLPLDDARDIVETVPPMTHTLVGCDFGVVDASAFCVVGWRDHDPRTYVLEVIKESGMTTSAAAALVQELIARHKPVQVIGDVGGLGKAYTHEMRTRWGIPIEAAEKVNRRGYVELCADAVASGRVAMHRHLAKPLIDECRDLIWDDKREKTHSGCEDHAFDAFLYTWRASLAYTERPAAVTPEVGSAAYYAQVQERLDECAEREESPWAA